MIKKFKKNLCICVNYRAFDTFIIKNRNTLLFIKNTLAKLDIVKIYIKFDIIAIFNKIRIRKDNKHKIVFIIRYNLFEYIVTLFDLCNTFSIF